MSDWKEIIENRVRLGAVLLDKNDPNWWTRIDLYDLDLQDSCWCVLGQLFDSYLSGLNELGLSSFDEDSRSCYRFGFDLEMEQTVTPHTKGLWSALDEAWIGQVKERANA